MIEKYIGLSQMITLAAIASACAAEPLPHYMGLRPGGGPRFICCTATALLPLSLA